jgi:glycosyltransferase involved in cell wall biosynthesis
LKQVAIIIPCLNEEKTLVQVIQSVQKLPFTLQIIIVNDGSTDGTMHLLEGYKPNPNFTLIHHPKPMGKGYCIIQAQKAVQAQVVAIQDADTEYNPECLIPMIKSVLQGTNKAVFGTRYQIEQKGYVHIYKSYLYGSMLVTYLFNTLFKQKLTDVSVCHKVFDANVFKALPLRTHGFQFCTEAGICVAQLGIRIPEMPTTYNPRTVAEGKKIRWRHGVQIILYMLGQKVKILLGAHAV